MADEIIQNIKKIKVGNADFNYEFVSWKDGNTNRIRKFCAGVDTKKFEKDGNICLLAKCEGPVDWYDLDGEVDLEQDDFDKEGIYINTEYTDTVEYPYLGDEYTISIDNINQLFIEEEGFLHFNNGELILSSQDIEDGIKIDIYAKAEDECNLQVSVNGVSKEHINIEQSEFRLYEFYFSKCDGTSIKINSFGNCFIDKIEIFKETIIDKGKASLCLDEEITANLPSGPLSVSGAIMVDGHSSGLASTPIGVVNKLRKIQITTN